MGVSFKEQLKALATKIGQKLSNKVEINGDYGDTLTTVGNAKQLISSVGVTDKVPYNFRTSGGSASIANRENDKIVGGTIEWNQLVETAGHITVPYGHKYISKISDTYTLSISYMEEIAVDDTDNVFDLTQMFGSIIADYIYLFEQVNAGAGVAWFRNLFPKPFYAHNAGELMSVCTNAHITRGFNAWDEEWEVGAFDYAGNPIESTNQIRTKNFIPIIPNSDYYFYWGLGKSVRMYAFNQNKEFLGYFEQAVGQMNSLKVVHPTASFIKFMTYAPHDVHTYNHDICINLSWSGYRNGEYKSYKEYIYPLSPVQLRGNFKLDINNKLYCDGDIYDKNGKITRKYKLLDLGTMNYTYISSLANKYFRTYLSDSENVGPLDIANAKIVNYRTVSADTMNNYLQYDKCFSVYGPLGELWIGANGYTDPATFKSAMSGKFILYELAESTTETATPFADPQIVDDFGTEEYIDALATAETNPRDVAIPVGHETFYPANLRDKLQNLPDGAPADGLYLVKQTGSKLELIAYTPESELPALPSDASTKTYGFKAINGVLTWVEE